MAKGNAQIEITASSSRLAAGLSAAHSKFQAFSASVGRGIGKSMKSLIPSGGVGSMVGNFASNMLTRGFDGVVQAGKDAMDFEKNLIRMQIASNGSAATTARLRTEIRAISRDTSIAASDVLAGAQAYVGFTGDAAGASAAAKLFADVSVATGTSVTDVAQAMSALKTSMGITAEQGEAAFSALIVQGKGGAVEIKDMAGELAALAPQFAQFKGGKSLGGLREMGAGFQTIMKNAGTASEAATKFRALMSSLADPRTVKGLKDVGVNVFGKDGKMREASAIFADIAKNTKLADPQKLAKIFGREEARSAVLAIREHIGSYNELRSVAEDTGAVQRDKMTFLESDVGKVDKAINGLKVSLAEAFTPERIAALVSALAGAADILAKIVGYAERAGEVIDEMKGDTSKRTERESKVASDKLIANAKHLTPEAKKRLGDTFLRGYAESTTQNTPGGWQGTAKDTNEATLLRAGQALREQAAREGDVWGAGGAKSSVFKSTLADPQARQIENEIAARNLTTTISDAILQGFQAVAPTKVQVGENQVARAADKATDARRRAH
jgi:TP901 family phage tail tape measure protein